MLAIEIQSYFKLIIYEIGAGIGTVGTANFCLNETVTVMHSGAGSGSGFGTGFGIRSKTKCNTKGKKIQNWRPNFWETILLLALRRQDFVQTFCC
jgi:hypothetical protein